MEPKAKARLDLFADNTQAIRREFPWRSTMLSRLAAFLCAAQGKAADPKAIRECHALIKEQTGLFSSFRGNAAMAVATLLSLSDDRTGLLGSALEVYRGMKEARFGACDHLVLAAFQIAANAPPPEYAERVERAKAFFDGMKRDHRFLTGQDDYLYAAMLGLSDIDVAAGVERLERLYQSLRPEFHSGTGVQALAQVLVLGGDESPERCVLTLREALRARGLKLDGVYTLSSLGVLALLAQDADAIAGQMAETSELLRTRKGFGPWSVSRQELLVFCAGLVALDSVDRAKEGILQATLSTSITNIVIAQQAAMAAAAAASASAAASSSS